MKKSFIATLVAAVLFLISWGFKGHQAVATIAENHLTPQAKAAVQDLLGKQSLAEVATWADEAREEPAFKTTGDWHFVNVPAGLSEAAFSAEVKAHGENNVYGAIQKARIILTQPQCTRTQKIEALKFLVHFVGDAHQPMHISHKEDKGGNTIQVRFDDKGTNLHTLWDSKLLDHQGLSVIEMSRQYDQATPAQIQAWQQDQPLQWLWESYQLSSKIYTEAVDASYYQNHIGIIRTRIDQAGIRLAGLLNDIYSGKVFSYTSAVPLLPEPDAVVVTGPAKMIDVKDAATHLNEEVTVTAKVYGTKDVGSMLLVNVGAAYPDSPLTVVLRGEARSLAVDGKTITVTGKVIDYKGKPEIIITDKTLIAIQP